MGEFLDAATGFPTAILSTLLGVVLVYWLLSVLGVVDFDGDGVHLTDAGGDVHEVGALTGLVNALGLQGVPLSIALSVLILLAWTLCCLGAMWLLPLLPGTGSAWAAGSILGLGSLSVAVPVTSLALRPLRGLFVTHTAIHNVALVGQTCRVLTQSVDERVGRAEVAQRGSNLNIRIWARSPNALKRGSAARIVGYEDASGRYRVEAES